MSIIIDFRTYFRVTEADIGLDMTSGQIWTVWKNDYDMVTGQDVHSRRCKDQGVDRRSKNRREGYGGISLRVIESGTPGYSDSNKQENGLAGVWYGPEFFVRMWSALQRALGPRLLMHGQNRVTYDAVQIRGSSGHTGDYLVEGHYRDHRILSIGGSTQKIMKEIISKTIL